MIHHVVFWNLAAETADQRAADAEGIRSRLEALDGRVPGMRSIVVRPNVYAEPRNHDLAVVADFDDEAALEAYLEHPDHLTAVQFIQGVVRDRVAIDVEL